MKIFRAWTGAAFFAASTVLFAADEPIVPTSLAKEQRENLVKFMKAHETPDRYIPAGAKFGDDPPTKAEEEIKATKEKPIKQYTVQVTPHRPVPGQEQVTKADVYYFRPNPEKGKHGITVKHTVDLATGEQIGETEVLTKAHTPISREELAESVAAAREDSPAVKALYEGREEKAVKWEYLQMKINRKSDQSEPGDRVIRLVFTATPGENEAAPAPVRVIVNLTKVTVIPDNR
jgi:hypothetical protein